MPDSPNPAWKPGNSISTPFTEMKTLSPEDMEVRDIYKLLIGSVLPRPIAFVSTISTEGVVNLAPFSFFNAVSSNPPLLMIAVGKKDAAGSNKDTAQNILDTKEFVINTAAEWLIEPLVYCAGSFAEGVNEMSEVGLTALKSTCVKPPRVKESPVQFECKLTQAIELGEGGLGSTTLFLGEIVKAHISSDAYENGRIDFDKIKSVGRLGGYQYGLISEVFELRPPIIKG